MGGTISQENKQILTNLIRNEVINSSTANLFFTVAGECQTVQVQKLEIGEGATVKSCNVLFNARAVQSCELEAKSTNEVKNKLETDIKSKLENLLDSKQESVQGFLATGRAMQISAQDIKNEISNIIKNFAETNISNTCVNKVTASQDQGIIFKKGSYYECPPNGLISFDAQINQESTLNCISSNLTDTIMQNKIINDIMNKMINDQRAKQEGFSLSFLIAILLLFLAPAAVVLFSSARLLAPVRNPKTGMVDLLPWAVNLTILILMWMILIALIVKLWESIKNYFKKIFDKLNPTNWGK